MRIESAAGLPLAWPASCFWLACACDAVCPGLGAAACVGIAALAAVPLYLLLSVGGELVSLGALRD